MSTDTEIRAFLDRMSAEPFVGPIDPEPFVRRARRRVARTLAVGAIVVVALGASAVGGISLLRSSPGIPADEETISPMPIPPLMANGPLSVIGFTNGVQQVTELGVGLTPLVDCKHRFDCTETDGVAWSPDGTQLAYTPECGGACASAGNPYHGLRVLDLGTGEDRLVIAGDDFGAVEWSPDATRIAYTTRSPGAIRIVEADGSSSPTHVLGTVEAVTVSWSPDGTRLAYSDRTGHMFVVTLDGSAPLSLGQGVGPRWSRDGELLAYLQAGGVCDVWTMRPDGTGATRLASLGIDPDGCAAYDFQPGPVWSPDGRKIAVWLRPSIRFVDVATGETHNLELPDAPSIYGITWRPVAAEGAAEASGPSNAT